MTSSLQKLLQVDVGGVKDFLASITPTDDAVQRSQDAVTALQSCLTSGTAVLVGSVAADLHMPKSDLDIVVTLPDFSLQTHAGNLQNIAAALNGSDGQQQGFSQVNLGEFSVQCRWKGLNLDILVGSSEPVSPLDFLKSDLTAHQRQALSASTAVATTAFLKQQPRLFKVAVRVVKHWAKVVHGKDWDDNLRNRPKPYLLVLLVLKAYQQYMVAVAASSSSSTSYPFAPVDPAGSNSNSSQDQEQEQAAAVEHIMVNFLRLAAGLSSNTLLFWELQFSSAVVQQVLARPDLASVLRPKGCERHPLVLDLANPTNNVAAAVPALDQLKQVATADLLVVEGDGILQLQQQLQEHKVDLQESHGLVMKLMAEQNTQAAHISALVLHQQIMSSKPTCNWSFDMPVADWLPDAKRKRLAEPKTVDDKSGLSLEVFNQPLQYHNDQPWAGVSFKLATSAVLELQTMIDLLLPIPVKVYSTSTVTLVNSKSSRGLTPHDVSRMYPSYDLHKCTKVADDEGVLQGSSGHIFWLDRFALVRLQLLRSDYYHNNRQKDLQYIKRRAQDVLKFDLRIQLAV